MAGIRGEDTEREVGVIPMGEMTISRSIQDEGERKALIKSVGVITQNKLNSLKIEPGMPSLDANAGTACSASQSDRI